MRRAAKRDTNERLIVDALTSVGASVQPLSDKGVPDLLVGWRGQNFLMEVKTPRGKLTDDQIDWHDSWRGEVHVVRSVDDALKILGVS